MVGEHSVAEKRRRKGRPCRKARALSEAIGKDFVGISSDNAGENPAHRKPKVSWVKLICSGLVGP